MNYKFNLIASGSCGGCSGGGCGFLCLRLWEVWAHITLEIKIGKLIGFAKLEKLAELRVCENATTIFRILKIMGTNILINFTSDLSASHLSAYRLVKESSKLFADLSWLHESRRGTVAFLTLDAFCLPYWQP